VFKIGLQDHAVIAVLHSFSVGQVILEHSIKSVAIFEEELALARSVVHVVNEAFEERVGTHIYFETRIVHVVVPLDGQHFGHEVACLLGGDEVVVLEYPHLEGVFGCSLLHPLAVAQVVGEFALVHVAIRLLADSYPLQQVLVEGALSKSPGGPGNQDSGP